MTKKGISDAVKQLTGISTDKADKAVSTVFQAIGNALARGEEVQILGFGTFKVSEVAERQGRNPATGEYINIPAHKAVRFSAGKSLKDKVNKD